MTSFSAAAIQGKLPLSHESSGVERVAKTKDVKQCRGRVALNYFSRQVEVNLKVDSPPAKAGVRKQRQCAPLCAVSSQNKNQPRIEILESGIVHAPREQQASHDEESSSRGGGNRKSNEGGEGEGEGEESFVAEEGSEGVSSSALGQGSALLGVALVLLIGAVGAGSYFYKDQVSQTITFFSDYIEEAGPFGYAAFVFGYAFLEVLAVPAIPLTMSAGLIFGSTVGTVLCSASATLAAAVAFLIARYVARDRILAMVQGNKKFLAIDKALGEDSFRVVTILRLSPLLPFSLGNYVYGLTSIKLLPYILGSWIGMLPGTWAYVSAGSFGRTLLESEEGVSLTDSSLWTLAAGLAVTVAAAGYVTNLAKNAMKDLD